MDRTRTTAEAWARRRRGGRPRARAAIAREVVAALVAGFLAPEEPSACAGRSLAVRGRGPERIGLAARIEIRGRHRGAPPSGRPLLQVPGGPPVQPGPDDGPRQDRPVVVLAGPGRPEDRASTGELVTPEAEHAIASGLGWLARRQNDDGSFGSGSYRRNGAVTSLGGLAMMASGSSPLRGPYGTPINRALNYVLENAGPAGLLPVADVETQGPMYSHGFGTLFIAEAYGMSRRPKLHERLFKADRLIVDTQNVEGGWRYQPIARDADLSVTICQINALRAARNAGVFVPKRTIDACIEYVRKSQNPDGCFRYVLQGGPSAFPRSAAGVVALYSAAVYDAGEIDRGIAYLKQHRPDATSLGTYGYFYYAHYYAAQAMWIRGRPDWDAWYASIRDELIRRKSADGSWHDGICDEYGTAMALLVLQMPNQLLPIFQR